MSEEEEDLSNLSFMEEEPVEVYTHPKRSVEMDEIFLREYLTNNYNAYKAAIAAGFSEATARNTAAKWVSKTRESSTKPDLFDKVQEALSGRLSHLDVTHERILEEYARLAFFDIGKMFKANGDLKNIRDMDEDTRRVIAGIDVGSNPDFMKVIKMKLTDKKGSLDSLARILGMFNDTVTVQHSFTDFLNEITNEAADEPLVLIQGEDNNG